MDETACWMEIPSDMTVHSTGARSVFVVKLSHNGWMNDTLSTDYLQSIIGQQSFNRHLLVWDSYRCHTSQSTRAETVRLHIDTAVVPGGCTKFIQAPDVVWNSCFKSHMRMQYDAWIATADGHE